jgi:hypothetical protein
VVSCVVEGLDEMEGVVPGSAVFDGPESRAVLLARTTTAMTPSSARTSINQALRRWRIDQ